MQRPLCPPVCLFGPCSLLARRCVCWLEAAPILADIEHADNHSRSDERNGGLAAQLNEDEARQDAELAAIVNGVQQQSAMEQAAAVNGVQQQSAMWQAAAVTEMEYNSSQQWGRQQ